MTVVGFTFMLEATQLSAALAEHMVELVRSDGWEVPPRYFGSIARPGRDLVRRRGMLRPKVLADELKAALLSPQTSDVTMSAFGSKSGGHAECWFETDVSQWQVGLDPPHLQSWGHRPLGAEVTWARWQNAVLAFADGAAAIQGVIYDATNWLHSNLLSTVLGEQSFGEARYPHYVQWERLRWQRQHVGDRYVRFPRWGTLYAHRHVEALGGIGKIVDVVRPAVVRELSGGVYFQLTESLAGLRSQEAAVKEQAFTALVEPLLPPVIVKEEVKHA